MPTQAEIAKHLDLSQSQVSRQLRELGLAPGTPLRQIRRAYLRRLREAGAQFQSADDGVNLTQVPSSPQFGPFTGPARPTRLFTQSDFWVHGVNVGLQIKF